MPAHISMSVIINRNRFTMPVNAVDVGLRWGREGFTCVPVGRDRDTEQRLRGEERQRKRAARKDPIRRSHEPAQIALSAGLTGMRRKVMPPKRTVAPTFVQPRRVLSDDLVAVALRGGLVVELDGKLEDLWPGDEIRIGAGVYHTIGIMTSETRWLYGLRPNHEE